MGYLVVFLFATGVALIAYDIGQTVGYNKGYHVGMRADAVIRQRLAAYTMGSNRVESLRSSVEKDNADRR